MGNVISDLNLDGRTGERSQSGDPVWGAAEVPSTGEKRLQRIGAWVGFVAALATIIFCAVLFYHLLQG